LDNRAFVHLFRTYGDYYIYDVNRNAIIKTEKRVWDLLKETKCDLDLICNNENTYSHKNIEWLIENGFLSSNKVKEILHPANEILEDYINNKIPMITLQVTQQCNLRCEYCTYSGSYDNREHTNQKMTFEMAKKGIDFLIDHSSDLKNIAVGFYGGEPLIEFELIKKTIEYVKENAVGKEVLFTITTNGTLINKNIIEYFYKNNVNLMISLDGPKEIYDKSRKFAFNSCGTFDRVMENINLIKKDFPEYLKNMSFNAVTDPQNDVGCVCKFFNDFESFRDGQIMYSEVANYYSKKEVRTSEKYYEVINYEYFKLLLSKLKKLDVKYTSKILFGRFDNMCQLYSILRLSEKLPDKLHHGGPCIPGAQRLFLNVHGDFYPCERVSESSSTVKIGNLEQGLDMNKISEILNIGKLSEENCKKCWAIRFCSLCVAAADDGNGLSKELKAKRCYGSQDLAENKLKDICTLKEFGYKFEKQFGYKFERDMNVT